MSAQSNPFFNTPTYIPNPSSVVALRSREDGVQRRFNEFHSSNPQIYSRLVEMARELKRRGVQRYSIAGLFEVLRYQDSLKAIDSGDGYKLSNNHRSRYARLIMAQEPDLAGFFATKELRAQ